MMNDLILLGLCLSFPQVCGHVHRHRLGDEPWAGIELQDSTPAFGAVSGFFDQFSLRGFEFVLTRIDAARGDLPKVVLGSVTILTLEEDARRRARVINSEHYD